jgi:hypothetical protein
MCFRVNDRLPIVADWDEIVLGHSQVESSADTIAIASSPAGFTSTCMFSDFERSMGRYLAMQCRGYTSLHNGYTLLLSHFY